MATAERAPERKAEQSESPPVRPMHVMVVVRAPGLLRAYSSALRLLAERGHRVTVVIERKRERLPGQLREVEALAEEFAGVSIDAAPKPETGRWPTLASQLRLSLDYLHYFHPRFEDAPDFRRRAARDAPVRARRLANAPLLRTRPGRRALTAILSRWERSLPVSEALIEFIEDREPEVVLVSPLIWFGAPQTDWIRAARATGTRTAAAIYSWDNLSSKGSMREVPDRVLVWNSTQVEEATELHGVPRDRLVATGAQSFDWWFDQEPSTSREEFCEMVGLPPDRPVLLYLESSGYVGGERQFLARWIPEMRRLGGKRLGEASILIRPHPQVRAPGWSEVGVAELAGCSVWPEAGQEPIGEAARHAYFDSIYHAHATVGVNTTAFIEGAIMDRPSAALLMPRFRKGQLGTVHFHYLLDRNGGPVQGATDLEEQAALLEEVLEAAPAAGPTARKFVESFVRPNGLEVSGGARFVAALEDLGSRPAPSPVVRHGGELLAQRAVEATLGGRRRDGSSGGGLRAAIRGDR